MNANDANKRAPGRHRRTEGQARTSALWVAMVHYRTARAVAGWPSAGTSHAARKGDAR